MVTRPQSIHMRKATTLKFRRIVILVSATLAIFAGYLAYRAYKILLGTPFHLASIVLLVTIISGIIIFVLLYVHSRLGVKREINYLMQYRVAHGIGRPKIRQIR